jgi:hypothetical protein
MQDWLRAFHGQNQPFPGLEIALKIAITLVLGLLEPKRRLCDLWMPARMRTLFPQ